MPLALLTMWVRGLDREFADRDNWRMPPLNVLAAPVISGARKASLTTSSAALSPHLRF